MSALEQEDIDGTKATMRGAPPSTASRLEEAYEIVERPSEGLSIVERLVRRSRIAGD